MMVRSRIASSSLYVQMNTSTSGGGASAASHAALRSASGAPDVALTGFGQLGHRNRHAIRLLGQGGRLYGEICRRSGNTGEPHHPAFVVLALAAEAKARGIADAQMVVGRFPDCRRDD